MLARLGEIVAWAKASGDRVGLFAALYRAVTREVERRIRRGLLAAGLHVVSLTESRDYAAVIEALDALGG